jgi:hypothetical protein
MAMTNKKAMVRALVVALVLYGATCFAFAYATGSPAFGSVDMVDRGSSREQVMSTMIRNSALTLFIYLLSCGVISLVGVGLASRESDDALVADSASGRNDQGALNAKLGTLVGVAFTMLFSMPVYFLVGRLQGAWITLADYRGFSGALSQDARLQWSHMGIPAVVLLVIGFSVAAVLGGWVGARFGARSTLAMWATAVVGPLALDAMSNLLHRTQVMPNDPIPALRATVDGTFNLFLALAVLWLPGMWLGVRMGRRPVVPPGERAIVRSEKADAPSTADSAEAPA